MRRTWQNGFPLALGLGTIVALVAAIGFWGANVTISGAVLGTGTIEVSTESTAVQHPVGGVVTEILARNGDVVHAGQVLLRLDDRQVRSDLMVTEGELLETLANIARLEAVIDDGATLRLDPFMTEMADRHPEIRALLDRQQRQLANQLAAMDVEWRLIGEQIRQVNDQILGNDAELAAQQARAGFVDRELTQIQSLADKGLSTTAQLFALEKDRIQTAGDIARLTARAAELRGRLSELDLARHKLRPTAREAAATELNKLRPERTRHQEKRASLLDALSKTEIRSPISGRVHDSRVMGLRSVVVAASPLLSVVPTDVPVVAVIRIAAGDVDQVFAGQEASLKFLAFNRRSQPLILGRIDRVSPDAFLDSTSRGTYYEATISLDASHLALLDAGELVPGMPVEAFITTEDRTPLDYVLRPVSDYLTRALRDG